MNQSLPLLAVLCQQFCILHSNSVLFEVARHDIKPSSAGFASWSCPACCLPVKLENGSHRMVRGKVEDMTEPVGAGHREAHEREQKSGTAADISQDGGGTDEQKKTIEQHVKVSKNRMFEVAKDAMLKKMNDSEGGDPEDIGGVH